MASTRTMLAYFALIEQGQTGFRTAAWPLGNQSQLDDDQRLLDAMHLQHEGRWGIAKNS